MGTAGRSHGLGRKNNRPSPSAKTHRPELPKQASYVKPGPLDTSGGLVWGALQSLPLPQPQPSASPSSGIWRAQLGWTGTCCLIWQFPSENKPHVPFQDLPEAWEPHLVLLWLTPSSWDEADKVNRTRPVRPSPPLSRPMLSARVVTSHMWQFEFKSYLVKNSVPQVPKPHSKCPVP